MVSAVAQKSMRKNPTPTGKYQGQDPNCQWKGRAKTKNSRRINELT